jgi:2-dehydro-3-deoxygluconokinase
MEMNELNIAARDAGPLDVVTFGEAMGLFIANEAGLLESVSTFSRATAGAELNVATGLARLGHRVGYISRFGDDSIGRALLAAIDRERIDRSHIAIDRSHPTGFMFKSRVTDGSDPAIEYFRRGSAASHLSVSDFAIDYCRGARILHLTGISPALAPNVRELAFHAASTMRALDRFVSFDPNLRPRLWASDAQMVECVNGLASQADLVLPGVAEGRILTGYDTPEDIVRFYLDLGVRAVVVKLGPAGACVGTAGGTQRIAGTPVTRVVDTVGAGDGFAVGVLSALLDGCDLAAAVSVGNAIGARVVQFPGDCDGLPTRAELDMQASNRAF